MNTTEQNNELKSVTIRARVEPAFKREVAMLAKFKHLEESDIVRIAVAQLIEKFRNASGAMNLL